MLTGQAQYFANIPVDLCSSHVALMMCAASFRASQDRETGESTWDGFFEDGVA